MSIVPSTIAAPRGPRRAGRAGLGPRETLAPDRRRARARVPDTLATQRTTHLIGTGQQVAQALTDGFRLAYLIGAALAAVAAVITFTSLPRPAAALAGAARRFGSRSARARGVRRGHRGVRGQPRRADRGVTTRGAYSFVTAPTLHPPRIRSQAHAPSGYACAGLHLHGELLRPETNRRSSARAGR